MGHTGLLEVDIRGLRLIKGWRAQRQINALKTVSREVLQDTMQPKSSKYCRDLTVKISITLRTEILEPHLLCPVHDVLPRQYVRCLRDLKVHHHGGVVEPAAFLLVVTFKLGAGCRPDIFEASDISPL